jgi:hypothetical protein
MSFSYTQPSVIMGLQEPTNLRKSIAMSTNQARPFTAATSKLAYAQAFTKPALTSSLNSPAQRRSRRPLLTSFRRFAHH